MHSCHDKITVTTSILTQPCLTRGHGNWNWNNWNQGGGGGHFGGGIFGGRDGERSQGEGEGIFLLYSLLHDILP